MSEVVPDYAGFAEQCRQLVTKMTGEHKEALEKMARAWDTLAREHGQLTDTKLPPR